MREIRIIRSDNKALPILYKEGWELKAISEGMMYMDREIPKIKKSTALVVKTGTNTLNFLLSCQQRAENAREWWENNGISIDILFEFSDYWLEKWENDKKYRFEKEKVFDIRRRLTTWINKPFNTNKHERWITILD